MIANFYGGPIAGQIRAYPKPMNCIVLPCSNGDEVVYEKYGETDSYDDVMAKDHFERTGQTTFYCKYNGSRPCLTGDMPPGLPAEFHEDWEFLVCWESGIGTTPSGKRVSKSITEFQACWRAALELAAKERLDNIKGTEDMALLLSQFKEASEEWVTERATLRSLLQESVEKCHCGGSYTHEERKKLGINRKCDLCRRTLAAVEGK